MRDPKWIGTSPSNPFWSPDCKTLYFSWNPAKAPSDSLYALQLNEIEPKKVSPAEKERINQTGRYQYNQDRSAAVYTYRGDIYYVDLKKNKTLQITKTADPESNPQFSFGENRIVYTSRQQLFAWDRQTGATEQLLQVKTPDPNASGRNAAGNNRTPVNTAQENWLQQDQIAVGAHEPGCAKVDPILVADNVTRQFGGLVAVDVAHVEIPRGKITALIGQPAYDELARLCRAREHLLQKIGRAHV